MLEPHTGNFLLQKSCQIHSIPKEFLSWQAVLIASHSCVPCSNHRYSSKLPLPERPLIQRLGTLVTALDVFFCEETNGVYVCPSTALAQLVVPRVYWASRLGQGTRCLLPDWGSIQESAQLWLRDGLFYVGVMDEDSGANGWPFHNTGPAICKAFMKERLLLDFNSVLSVHSNILSNCVTRLRDTATGKSIKRFAIVLFFPWAALTRKDHVPGTVP